jgi:pyruvate dehydrogenase E2 component (dihydrolipoyllysine-residue acetyltransferase)
LSEELVMPRLSDTMEEGTIGRWVVHEGDAYNEGDILAEIETDKATMEFQAYDGGTLLKILVGDGESAPLGAPIAIVGEPGEEVPDSGGAPQKQEPEAEPEAEEGSDAKAETGTKTEAAPAEEKPDRASQRSAEPAPATASGNGHDGSAGLRVSPIARKMADQAGIDLRGLAGQGSGPEGRIVKADVERLLAGGRGAPAAATTAPRAPASQAQPAAAPAEAEMRDLTPMLKAVAARMTQSTQTVPHFYVESEIDMTRALELRRELNEGLADRGEKISVNDLIVRACALALIEHPQAHRSYIDGRHAYHPHANIGIAVALDDGLIVPVVFGADTKSLREISRESRDLAGRAREGKLKQREIEGGTFTVSNLGMFDVANFQAIINPPESGILAVGATVPRPVAADGQVTVRQLMRVTLSCDHRACSGADGARLLQTVKRLLQSPSLLLA